MASSKEYQMLFQLSANLASGFTSTFSKGGSSITELQSKINALNKTNNDISAYQRQQDAIAKTQAQLERLHGQYDRLAGVEAQTGTEEAELKNKMEDKQATIDKTNEKLQQQQDKLQQMGAALENAGVDTSNLASESERLKNETEKLAASQEKEANAAESMGKSLGNAMQGAAAAVEALGAAEALKSVYNELKECSAAAAEYETAMAGVKRTVGGSDEFISGLGESFKALSTQMPITAGELASIATTAGQLGIAQSNVETFTKVMAQLATTTDLTADNAATMLAQFANITGTTDYERLGSAVASLGDATATTASKVVEMSQGMAASASLAGMSETDILAIAAAVGSLGIEAASGSTSMSTLISTLYKATETGDGLEEFASVAGMTANEFKTAWGEDAVGALDSFIQGLNDTERNGRSAVVILDELGIKNVRQTKAILGLASAGDLLSSTIAQANAAWDENAALGEKASVMYNTTEAKMTMLQNAANNVQIAIGDALNPALGEVAELLTSIIEPMSEWIEAHPALVQAITAFVGVLGTLVVGVTAYTAAAKLAAVANGILSASFPALAVIGAIATGVGALVYALNSLSDADADVTINLQEVSEEYENLDKQLKEQEGLSETLDKYENLNKILKGKHEASYSAKAEGEKLTDEDFVDSTGTVDYSGDVAEGNELLTDENFLDVEEDPTVEYGAEVTDPLTDEEIQVEDQDIIYTTDLRNPITDEDVAIAEQEIVYNNEYERLAAELYQISPQTIEYISKLDSPTYQSVLENAKQLGKEVLSTKNNLDAAKDALAESQAAYSELETKLSTTRSKKEKNQLQEEMEKLTTTISGQKRTVAELQGQYDELSAEYDTATTAALELKKAEDELAGMQEQLGITADEAAGSIEEQTSALREQLEVQQALTKLKMQEAAETAKTGIGQQINDYATNYYKLAKATETAKNAAEELNNVQGADDVAARLDELFTTMNQHASATYGSEDYWDWDSSEMQAYRQEFENLMDTYAMDGKKHTYSGLGMMYQDLLKMNEETIDVSGGMKDLGRTISESDEAATEAQAAMTSYVDSVVRVIENGSVTAEEAEQLMRDSIKDTAESTAIVDQVMEQVNQTMAEHAMAAEEAAAAEEELAKQQEEVTDSGEGARRTFDDVVKDLDNLKEAYNTAYEAAKKSIDGQFNLFEKANTVRARGNNVNKGSNSYVKGLQSQEAYVKQYTTNYENAAKALQAAEDSIYGKDQNRDVSTSLLAQLADGSAESAQILADLATASQSDIEALVTQYASLESTKSEYASTVADIETDFSDTMKTLKEELQTTVQEMDFSQEGAAKAQASMAAYTSTIGSFEGEAKKQAEKVMKAVEDALSANPTITIHVELEDGALDGLPNIKGQEADGTTNAVRGVHLVGEEGPELVFMHGGEAVMDAQKTAELLQNQADSVNASPVEAAQSVAASSQNYNVTVSPVYNVSGSNAAEVKSILEEQSASLRETVEDIITDMITDQNRRQYA